MAVVTQTAPCDTKLPETLYLNTNIKCLHDASFSSYLNRAGQDSIVCQQAESRRDPGSGICNQDDHKNRFGITSQEVGELGVFGAEKYFNGVMDHQGSASIVAKQSNARNCKETDQLDRIVIPSKIKPPGTPSAHSQSSWNSQSVLSNFKKNPFQSKNKKGNKKKSLLAILGCKCSCYDKNSVAVQDQFGEISFSKNAPSGAEADTRKYPDLSISPIKKSNSESWLRDGNMQKQTSNRKEAGLKAEEQVVEFPSSMSNESGGNFPVEMHSGNVNEEINRRKSLEVFGSPVYEKRSKSLALDPKRLPRLSWDAKAKVKPELEIPGEVFSDGESDASSSDLFEIESITGKTNPNLRRQASDTTSDFVTSTTCYAPSEASNE